MIEVEKLRKVFPNGVIAVDGVSFTVAEGEIFGLLGPNGAGKSTTIAILTTLIAPTGGKALVAGVDVCKHPTKARFAFGYVSQDLAVDDNLTGYDNLRLQAGFYHLSRREAEPRIAEVLKMVELTDRAGDLVETYSGGMRKRLDIACGLIHRPRLLFLDEPTLGLDIQTRREIWRYISELRAEINMTIFLTTHYMEEADALCDRIAIIDYGQIKALDAPAALKSALGGDLVNFRFDQGHAGGSGRGGGHRPRAALGDAAPCAGRRRVSGGGDERRIGGAGNLRRAGGEAGAHRRHQHETPLAR